MQSKYKNIFIVIFSILLLIGLGFLIYTYNLKTQPGTTPEPIVVVPAAGDITVKGTMECLPHKNTNGPQTLECAFGLKDENGTHFALRDTDPGYKNISNIATGAPIIVKGTFIPSTDTKYQSIGIIEVASIAIADVPQRVTLSGTFVCLPHKDTTDPQTEECTFGLKAADGKYYAIDFNLASQTAPEFKTGEKFTGSGLLVPVEQLSSNHWQKYNMVGIFSVTDFKK